MIGGAIGSALVLGENMVLEVLPVLTDSVPKISCIGCWFLCTFWLAVPYVFADDKKGHTWVFASFLLGVLMVTVLMSLPFWSTGGDGLLVRLAACLVLPLAFFVRGWWFYLEESYLEGLPARIKLLIGIVVGILVVYVCIWMLQNGGVFDTIIFSEDAGLAADLLTLASAGGICVWVMTGIGVLCVAATAIFSIREMKWLLAPDCRRRRT